MKWGVLVLLVWGAGCNKAGPMPLNRAALRVSQPQTIVATLPPIPEFEGWTTDEIQMTLLFGLIGRAIAESGARTEGKHVRAAGLHDPADGISAVLITALANRYALQVLDAGRIQTKGASGEELSDEYPHSDLVLDVRTTEWGFAPTSPTRLTIFYEGSLRLVDTRRKTVVAEGTCLISPTKRPDDPSLASLMWRDGAILKQKFGEVIRSCVDQYRTSVLNLTTDETWGRGAEASSPP